MFEFSFVKRYPDGTAKLNAQGQPMRVVGICENGPKLAEAFDMAVIRPPRKKKRVKK